MELDRSDQVFCAVTTDLVDEIANRYPEMFIKKGVIQTDIVLFALGFKVNFNMYNRDYKLDNDQIIRDNVCRHMTYKANVYRGRLRKAVKEVVDGKIHFSREDHALAGMYDEYTVLQPSNLSRYTKDKVFTRIEDIGWVG